MAFLLLNMSYAMDGPSFAQFAGPCMSMRGEDGTDDDEYND